MIEEKEIKMPVCPFCKSEMSPIYFHGYYESFPMWECKCEEIPGSEVSRGAYA
jgi:transposase-like protein